MPESCAAPCLAASNPSKPAPPKAADKSPMACQCRACCCGQPPIVKPCYKQPRRPDSYAPQRCYMQPEARVESCTTYKMSYLPVDGNLKGKAVKPIPSIMRSTEPMEGYSVQKLSYLPNPVCITQKIHPCHHDLYGKGPMATVTTQKHDFVPKKSELRESFKPLSKFEASEHPFENLTVNKLSFLPPQRIELTRSCAPNRCYERPNAKMEGTTTHKSSYMPVVLMPKEPVPWGSKNHYESPSVKLDTNTTYTMSFLDAQSDCRRFPILPNAGSNPVTCSKAFETQTVYKNSYLPAKAPRPTPVKPTSNLQPSTAAMDGDTVQKLSYLPNPVCITQKIHPCHHDLYGKGPMATVTTQKHDFVPKKSELRESFKPVSTVKLSKHPFEDRTVCRLSFIDPGRCARPNNYAPMKCYEKPNAKMEGTTTQKLSYQKICVPVPQKPSWAMKRSYDAPSTKLEGTTVYRSSFLPPGEDCTEYEDPCKYGDCNPCVCTCPAECITKNPCACDFPKAALSCA